MKKEKDLSGAILEFAEHGRIWPAYCIGSKDKRIRIILPTGKEGLLPRTRLLHISNKRYRISSRQEQISLLKEIDQKRDFIKQGINLEELWEVVVDEAEEISPEELAEIFFGDPIDDDKVAALIRSIIENKFFFRFRQGQIVIFSRQEVKRLKERKKKEQEKLKRQEEGVLWLSSLIKGKSFEVSESVSEQIIDYWLKVLKNYYLFGEEARQAREAKEILKRVGITRPGQLFRILQKAGIFTEDENIELLRYELKEEFSSLVIEEVKKLLAQKLPWTQERKDFTSLEIFTIDGPETKDFDDALHIEISKERYLLGVHITDIEGLISKDSLLFQEAVHRGTTLYLPDRIIPMLPPEISEELASLKEGKVRPALSFLIEVSKEGEIISWDIVLSWIKVKERLTYDQVDENIKQGGIFRFWYDISQALFRKRIKGGALPIFLPEITVRVLDGELLLERIEFTPSRFLVSEFMILANYIAALFFQKKDIPAIYRTQTKPREKILEAGEKDILKNFLQLKHLSRGELLLNPEFHHGLGLPAYTTITSPIRRALDLIMELQLVHYLKTKEILFSSEQLTTLLRELENSLEKTSIVKTRTHKYWLLKYLKKYVKGEPLEGIVIDSFSRKAKVLLPDYMITVDVPLPPTYIPKIGTYLKVVLRYINPREENIKAFLYHN